jgi:hypothetical protein
MRTSERVLPFLLVAAAMLIGPSTTDAWGGGNNNNKNKQGATSSKKNSDGEVECRADGTCTPTTTTPNAKKAAAAIQCSVYMAPSSLGEETSLGIYTGIDLKPDTVINYPEIAVPILFREFGEHVAGFHDGVLWDRYIWEGEVMEIETYIETNRHASRSVFVPGVGCTVNSILDMNNVDSTHGSTYDTQGLHRSKDPGSGAFTPYHGATTTAIREVSAGSELFASYGDYWIPDIPGAQVTLEGPLNEAEHFLRNVYYPFVSEYGIQMSDELKQALWDFTVKDFPIYSQAMSNLPRKAPWADVEAALKDMVAGEKGTRTKKIKKGKNGIEEDEDDKSVVRQFIRKQSLKSIEWLDEHGYCQDHLKPGKSTVPQAGYGAFASRDLPAGTVVGYAPLVHIGIHGREIFSVTVGDGTPQAKRQYDLILNYSFGHRNSTVLLTPYGAMVNYINHGAKDKSNIKLRWPTKELIAHKPYYLDKTPTDLRDTVDKIGLSFEYVAIRDIKEDEEVFLDYGEEWEQAWEAHVARWEPVPGAAKYVHSSSWEEETYRTVAEQQGNPYPDNLHTMCHASYSQALDGSYQWVEVLRPLPYRVHCEVLERNEADPKRILYIVELEAGEEGETVVVHNVPEEGIYLYDRAFSADWHLPNVFRHEIMIPDDIMPPSWHNGPPPQPDHAMQ